MIVPPFFQTVLIDKSNPENLPTKKGWHFVWLSDGTEDAMLWDGCRWTGNIGVESGNSTVTAWLRPFTPQANAEEVIGKSKVLRDICTNGTERNTPGTCQEAIEQAMYEFKLCTENLE